MTRKSRDICTFKCCTCLSTHFAVHCESVSLTYYFFTSLCFLVWTTLCLGMPLHNSLYLMSYQWISLSPSFCFSSNSQLSTALACPVLSFLGAVLLCCCVAVLLCCCVAVLPLTPAKLMNGYMVLTNGGSRSGSSPSLYSRPPSRTLSRPAGDIILSMDSEPSVRKMDTVVKLEAVSLSVCVCVCVCVCVFNVFNMLHRCVSSVVSINPCAFCDPGLPPSSTTTVDI